MISGGRKTLGIFINKNDTNFQETVQRISQKRARELGYDAFYFFTVGYRESVNYYDTQEKGMFAFVPMEKLDGVLVTPDSYDMPGFREALFDMLDKRAKCPIVCVRDCRSPYDSIYTEESHAIRPMLRHLLDDHGFRKVCFEAGYKGHPDGDKRLECYLDEMAKRSIPLPPNAIHYGTMWTRGADLAYHQFFDDPDNIPEAIVCANDHMAIALMAEIQDHGYRIPEDVVVVGFDNIEITSHTYPTLSTVGQDYDLMISSAMDLLHERIQQQARGEELPPPEHRGIAAGLFLRESCGCQKNTDLSYLLEENRHMARTMREIQSRETSQAYFSIELNSSDDYEGIHRAIVKKLADTPTMRDFYLCMFEDENGFAGHITPKVRMISAIRDREDVMASSHISFDREELLPALANRPGEPQAFYVHLLHQRDSTYGYTVMQFLEDEAPSLFYSRWNILISLALRNLDDQFKLKTLYEERRKSSILDALTGLYNRRGFDEALMPQWEALCEKGETVSFISLDLDNLKVINDTFGHKGGDEALCIVAKAIRAAIPEGAIPVRNGGDEYLIFIPKCDHHGVEQFRLAFEATLIELSKGLPYTVGASVGAKVGALYPGCTVAQCIHASDEAMYVDKKHRHELLARHAKTLR